MSAITIDRHHGSWNVRILIPQTKSQNLTASNHHIKTYKHRELGITHTFRRTRKSTKDDYFILLFLFCLFVCFYSFLFFFVVVIIINFVMVSSEKIETINSGFV